MHKPATQIFPTTRPTRFIPSTPLTIQSAIDYVKNIPGKNAQFSECEFIPVAARKINLYDSIPAIEVSCIYKSYNEDGTLNESTHWRDCWTVWEIPLTGNIAADIKPGTPVALYGEW